MLAKKSIIFTEKNPVVFKMVDFDNFDQDTLKDTFRLLDEFNEEGFNWRDMKIFSQPADEYIENFFDRKKRRSRTDKLFKSFPDFASAGARTSADFDTDLGNDVFSFTKNRFRRSESSYSTTSGYETSSSNETISEEVNDRRRDSQRSTTPSESTYSSRSSTPFKSKYSPSSSASTPFQTHSKPSTRARTYSQRHDSDLSKKLENQFMKDERHSVPHEIYSDCQHSFDDHDRPHSVPVNNVRGQVNGKCKDSDSSFRFSPSISINNSRDSLCSEPLDRFMSRLSSFSSGSSRCSSVSQDGRNSSPKQQQPEVHSDVDKQTKVEESNVSNNLPDVLKGDPNGPLIRNIPIAMPDKGDNQSWSQRQGRIEGALKWLRSELVS